MSELEHIAELDRGREVRKPEVVAMAVVNANGNADARMVHGGIVAPAVGRALVALAYVSKIGGDAAA